MEAHRDNKGESKMETAKQVIDKRLAATKKDAIKTMRELGSLCGPSWVLEDDGDPDMKAMLDIIKRAEWLKSVWHELYVLDSMVHTLEDWDKDEESTK